MQRAANIAFRLQETVTSTLMSWDDNWLPCSATVAKVLAGVEVYLLSILKSNHTFHAYSTKHALLVSTYIALFFYLSAGLSALVLTNRFGEFPARASWKRDAIQRGNGSNRSRQWVWVMRHCLISLIMGTISLIMQALLYGRLEESVFVKGALSVIMAFAVLFLKHLIRLLLRD